MKYIASANCSLLNFPVCLVSARALGGTWDAIKHHTLPPSPSKPWALPPCSSADEHLPEADHSMGVRFWPTELTSARSEEALPPTIHLQLTGRVKAFLCRVLQKCSYPIKPCADGAGLHSFLFIDLEAVYEPVGTRATAWRSGDTLPAQCLCA